MRDDDSNIEMIRCLHIDFKGLSPTFERMLQLVPIIRRAGFNAVLLEFEDVFPWTIEPAFRADHCYSKEQVKQLCRDLSACGIEIIPLVQCLGHMEMVLSTDAYAHLRECCNRTDVINPLMTASRELLIHMYTEVIDLCGRNRYFCLGGDEAATLGGNFQTFQYLNECGEAKLYLQHIKPLCQWLIDKRIRPLLWADMMATWPEDQLVELRRYADLCVWGYQERHFEKSEFNCHPDRIKRFAASGITLWAAGAYKGADLDDSDLPDYEKRSDNMKRWLALAQDYRFEGIVSTGWSRYSTNRVQCEPLDAALDSLINHGHLLATSKSLVTDETIADIIGMEEYERFKRRKELLAEFRLYRDSAWIQVRILHEIISLFKVNSTKIGSGSAKAHLKWLESALGKMNAIAKEIQRLWKGLVSSKSMTDYLFTERINPLEEQRIAIRGQLECMKQGHQNREP